MLLLLVSPDLFFRVDTGHLWKHTILSTTWFVLQERRRVVVRTATTSWRFCWGQRGFCLNRLMVDHHFPTFSHMFLTKWQFYGYSHFQTNPYDFLSGHPRLDRKASAESLNVIMPLERDCASSMDFTRKISAQNTPHFGKRLKDIEGISADLGRIHFLFGGFRYLDLSWHRSETPNQIQHISTLF